MDEVSKIGEALDELEGDERLVAFARAVTRRVPPELHADPPGVVARVRSLFAFVSERHDDISVRAFNPSIDTHGYATDGTVVEFNLVDRPFLLDSVTNEVEAFGLSVTTVLHPVIGVERDEDGRIETVTHHRDATSMESVQHYELDRRLPESELAGLEHAVGEVLRAVAAVVSDFEPMRGRTGRMARYAREAAGHVESSVIEETEAFLDWLADDNFVFLGYREYRVFDGPGGRSVSVEPDSGLGILRDERRSAVAEAVPLADLERDVAERFRNGDLLVITKTNRISPVHRAVKMDYIGLRLFDDAGETAGEARLIGLFTSKAYMEPAAHTPILRRKLADIVATEDLIEGSHDHKAFVALFEGFSKHDLFAAATTELRETLRGMLESQEREHVRLFVRRDLLQRNVSVLVTMPRDRFNADLRQRLQRLFVERFAGDSVDYHLALGEAEAAQLHFTIWVEGADVPEVDYAALEAEVRQLARSWDELLFDALVGRIPDDAIGPLVDEWALRLPDYYRASTPVHVAAGDVMALQELADSDGSFVVGIQNERPGDGHHQLTRIALYRSDGKRPLSELLPALEDLGLAVVEEVPTRLIDMSDHVIHDFGVLWRGELLDLDHADAVVESLTAVWGGEATSDDLDRLIICAGLSRRQVEILRAYRTYWRRVAPVFTMAYVNETLVGHPDVAADLVRLFELRFDPVHLDPEAADALVVDLGERLDAIPSIEQDRILRSFLRLIEATLRTNAYSPHRESLAFKFRSPDVPDAPLPHPRAEIFVLARDVEGIHLRGGLVARGGIRWSDRREDYRTEVLGLMKAQMTKNAVIVPTGAKGGFVLHDPPAERDELRAAVQSGYRTFIGALLDLTDNRVRGDIAHPPDVVVRDGEDPYLVVAADKGTATFSDLANSIAAERGFWLGDAFASGGSSGYDHKELGITARGAWESLRRHFVEIGIDPADDPFTVVGIGDMSGDVFGNGMLLSDRIRLVAAFDHRHIFLDPDPDPARSMAERTRLFGVPGSSWADYDSAVLSDGGAIHPRTAKQIPLAPAMREVLGTELETVGPNDLISLILSAPVDLLWNGGIGTYVKATSESHDAAGDRANDAVRVNGSQVKARVVVEGGNLGLTQKGRIEYAESGGRVNTDFIDNSGGVDCSDREVNLKILLAAAVEDGELSIADRDRLIADVASDVVGRILRSNGLQARLLSREQLASSRRMESYEELMVLLERSGLLDRSVEGLPGSEEMTERTREGRGLARPQLAVLLAYAKRWLRLVLVGAPISASDDLVEDLGAYFPPRIASEYRESIARHPLRRELVATLVANDVVNSQGIVFVSRLASRTGADPAEVVAAYRIARDVARAGDRRRELDEIAGTVPAAEWMVMSSRLDDMVGSLTRWYVSSLGTDGIDARVARDAAAFVDLEAAVLGDPESWRSGQRARYDALAAAGVPEGTARHQAVLSFLASGPDLVEVARERGRSPVEVLGHFRASGRLFGIDRLGELSADVPVRSAWDRWALWAIEEDLLGLRRMAAEAVMAGSDPGDPPAEAASAFLDTRGNDRERLERFLSRVEATEVDVAALTVAVRQVRSVIS